MAYFQYVLHPNDTSLTAQNRNLPFVQKCFGAIKHFRSSTPHTSLDGSRIIKAIQTQSKALINTPSSGFEVLLRLKYLLAYIVVQVIVSCELFPIIKSKQSRLKIAAAKKGGNSLWTRPYAVLLDFSFVQRTDTRSSSVTWKILLAVTSLQVSYRGKTKNPENVEYFHPPIRFPRSNLR